MASMNGGHFLTVMTSFWSGSTMPFWGAALNQAGRPCTAGIGSGRIGLSADPQRNVNDIGPVSFMVAAASLSPAKFAALYEKSISGAT